MTSWLHSFIPVDPKRNSRNLSRVKADVHACWPRMGDICFIPLPLFFVLIFSCLKKILVRQDTWLTNTLFSPFNLKRRSEVIYTTKEHFFYFFFTQYWSRGIQFSRASLNGALTTQKHSNIKTRKLIKLQRLHVPQALLYKKWRLSLILKFAERLYLSNDSR